MIQSVVSVLKAMNGAITYSEIMNMELVRFSEVVMQIQIINSAESQEASRQENHTRAQNGTR